MVTFLTYLQRLSLFERGGRAIPTYVGVPKTGIDHKLIFSHNSLFGRAARIAHQSFHSGACAFSESAGINKPLCQRPLKKSDRRC